MFVVRHGNVLDHQGDVVLTEEGRHNAFDAGSRLAEHIPDGAQVRVLCSPTVRTRETAEELALGLVSIPHLHEKANVEIPVPRVEPAIRNLEIIVDGHPVLPTDAMHPSLPPSAEQDSFLQGFWQADEDRIGYWMTHLSESAESPAAVAARLDQCFESLLASERAEIFILVTHSGPMRAFLRQDFGQDPGEPDYCEWFHVNKERVDYRGETAAR
ncbi:MAG: histidine phosphatase family protein [Acidobacteriota bacterium]